MILAANTWYAILHDEKCHILVPIIFGALTIISIAIALGDRKEKES